MIWIISLYFNVHFSTLSPLQGILPLDINHFNHVHPPTAKFSQSFKAQSLQWRHDGIDGVSNHKPHDCLLNRLFRRGSQKTSKLCVTGLCDGNSPATNHDDAIQWKHLPRHLPFVNSPHKGPVTRKMFPFDNVIMIGRPVACGVSHKGLCINAMTLIGTSKCHQYVYTVKIASHQSSWHCADIFLGNRCIQTFHLTSLCSRMLSMYRKKQSDRSWCFI